MDKEELQKNIALYYSKLSPEAQVVFSEIKWLETLKTIALKYSLDEKQTETLGTETMLVLLGIIHSEEYEKILKTELELPGDLAKKILEEIDNSVLKSIRPKLTEAFNTNVNQNIEEVGEEPASQEEIDERFRSLPNNVQQAIAESKYRSNLYAIMQENDLNVEQMGLLEEVIVDLMRGIIPSEKFKEAIKAKLGIADNRISIIADAINEKILKEIRKKMMAQTEEEEKMETPTKVSSEEKQVLESAGIQIENGEKTISSQPVQPSVPAISPAELEAPPSINPPEPKKEEFHPVRSDESSQSVSTSNGIHPILAQKLSDSVKNEVIKTEHILEKPTNDKKYKIDPYREVPE